MRPTVDQRIGERDTTGDPGRVRVVEEAVLFGSASTLVGILTDPPAAARNGGTVGVLLLNAGLLHRVGPNRLYVELARRLASRGMVVLRFDYSGIGDSAVRRDNLPFEQRAVGETQEAMDFVGRTRGIERFVLMGLCSGAVNAFHTARLDPRVVGAVLINPQGYNAEFRSLAEAYRYWQKVLAVVRAPRRWLTAIPRNLSYQAMTRNLRRALSSNAPAAALRAEFHQLIARGVDLLVLFSSPRDRSRYQLGLIVGGRIDELASSGRLTLETFGQATHTFTLVAHQTKLLDTIEKWTGRST